VTFLAVPLAGAFLIRPERHHDERGFFARTWCADQAVAHGLNPRVVQCNVSYTERAGTVRGLHYQAAPWAEAKLVRCTRGAIHDVIIDLRPDSATYLRHTAVELSAENGDLLYVPEGFAHGFQTVTDGVEVSYQMSQVHAPAYARGIRWDDPMFGIAWPRPVTDISPRDRRFPDFAILAGGTQ
jgi:dTDP-4-dehydrorhamnose 3,5-epimerase